MLLSTVCQDSNPSHFPKDMTSTHLSGLHNQQLDTYQTPVHTISSHNSEQKPSQTGLLSMICCQQEHISKGFDTTVGDTGLCRAGPYQVAGAGGLARSSSGMRNLARVSPTSSSSLYRLGYLAALSPSFLGINAPPAPRRLTPPPPPPPRLILML